MTRTVEEIILEIERRIKEVDAIRKEYRESPFDSKRLLHVHQGEKISLMDLLEWIKSDDEKETETKGEEIKKELL